MRSIRSSLLFVLALSVAGPAVAAPRSPAAERTDAFIATFKKVKSGATSAADKAANEKVFAALDGFFDFDTLTAQPIAPRADKFSPAQKEEFSKRFRAIVRGSAYPDSGAFFSRAKLKVGEAKAAGDDQLVTIDASVPAEDLQTAIELRWRNVKGVLRVVDIGFDGDSLVKDYQSQFARIIDKDGVAGLLNKLAEREAAIAKGSAK